MTKKKVSSKKYKIQRHPNGRKVRSNKGKKRGPYKKKQSKSITKHNKEDCYIIDVNNKKQILPREYPGDEWVHQNLLKHRDIDLKYYQQYHPEILTNSFNRYHQMCYN